MNKLVKSKAIEKMVGVLPWCNVIIQSFAMRQGLLVLLQRSELSQVYAIATTDSTCSGSQTQHQT